MEKNDVGFINASVLILDIRLAHQRSVHCFYFHFKQKKQEILLKIRITNERLTVQH